MITSQIFSSRVARKCKLTTQKIYTLEAFRLRYKMLT